MIQNNREVIHTMSKDCFMAVNIKGKLSNYRYGGGGSNIITRYTVRWLALLASRSVHEDLNPPAKVRMMHAIF